MFRLYLYDISADGGQTWTSQWLIENEAEEEKKNGWIVKKN